MNSCRQSIGLPFSEHYNYCIADFLFIVLETFWVPPTVLSSADWEAELLKVPKIGPWVSEHVKGEWFLCCLRRKSLHGFQTEYVHDGSPRISPHAPNEHHWAHDDRWPRNRWIKPLFNPFATHLNQVSPPSVLSRTSCTDEPAAHDTF